MEQQRQNMYFLLARLYYGPYRELFRKGGKRLPDLTHRRNEAWKDIINQLQDRQFEVPVSIRNTWKSFRSKTKTSYKKGPRTDYRQRTPQLVRNVETQSSLGGEGLRRSQRERHSPNPLSYTPPYSVESMQSCRQVGPATFEAGCRRSPVVSRATQRLAEGPSSTAAPTSRQSRRSRAASPVAGPSRLPVATPSTSQHDVAGPSRPNFSPSAVNRPASVPITDGFRDRPPPSTSAPTGLTSEQLRFLDSFDPFPPGETFHLLGSGGITSTVSSEPHRAPVLTSDDDDILSEPIVYQPRRRARPTALVSPVATRSSENMQPAESHATPAQPELSPSRQAGSSRQIHAPPPQLPAARPLSPPLRQGSSIVPSSHQSQFRTPPRHVDRPSSRQAQIRTPQQQADRPSSRQAQIRTPQQQADRPSSRQAQIRTPQQQADRPSSRHAQARTPQQQADRPSSRHAQAQIPQQQADRPSSRHAQARTPRQQAARPLSRHAQVRPPAPARRARAPRHPRPGGMRSNYSNPRSSHSSRAINPLYTRAVRDLSPEAIRDALQNVRHRGLARRNGPSNREIRHEIVDTFRMARTLMAEQLIYYRRQNRGPGIFNISDRDSDYDDDEYVPDDDEEFTDDDIEDHEDDGDDPEDDGEESGGNGEEPGGDDEAEFADGNEFFD